MKSIFGIIFKTNKTLDYLDGKDSVSLDFNNVIIFLIFGLITAIETYYKDFKFMHNIGIGFSIFLFVFQIGLSFLIGYYLISYLIYWIGKRIKGQAKLIDVQTVIAYSLIPTLLVSPILTYIHIDKHYSHLPIIVLWIYRLTGLVVTIICYKIMIQGLIRFNRYRFFNALINISPLILTLIGLIAFVIIKK